MTALASVGALADFGTGPTRPLYGTPLTAAPAPSAPLSPSGKDQVPSCAARSHLLGEGASVQTPAGVSEQDREEGAETAAVPLDPRPGLLPPAGEACQVPGDGAQGGRPPGAHLHHALEEVTGESTALAPRGALFMGTSGV